MASSTGATTGNEIYSYDPLDNLCRAHYDGVDRRYVYDASYKLSRIQNAAGVWIAS